MLSSVLMGLLAAVVVFIPRALYAWFPAMPWASSIFILGVAAIAMVLQRFVLDRQPGSRGFDGLVDLLIHIHSPAHPDPAPRWGVRAAISLLLRIFGAPVGGEGAGIEALQSAGIRFRSASSRWYEHRRRTDAGIALAAGIAASFHAPFAGVLIATELGIGGRTVTTALAAISAFVGTQVLSTSLGIEPISFLSPGTVLPFWEWKSWVSLAGIAVAAGLLGWLAVRFIRYSQESLMDLLQTQAWMRTLAGGILLFLLAFVYKRGTLDPERLFYLSLHSQAPLSTMALAFLAQLLGIALVISAFGTTGVFWPVFALGGVLGYLVHPPMAAGLVFIGGAAMMGSVLGTPIAAAVLGYEISGNIQVVIPCWIAAWGARKLRDLLKSPSLVEADLHARGLELIDGRSSTVLEGILVREAMITDFETVHEQEPISELYARLLKSRYPFLPVLNTQGIYLGLITVDMVQEGWEHHDRLTGSTPLSRLLEAKDLLYRSGVKFPTILATDKLSRTAGLFRESPCIPVLGTDQRCLGLLFVYNVRLAYDREVARRSLLAQFADGP